MSLCESICHTAAENQVVNLVHKVFDDADLGRNFRTTHDCCKRTLDVVEHVFNGCNFFFHQVAEHLVVCVEIVGDDSCRSVTAVSCAECVVNVAVSVACESFCEFLLALFHFFLGCVVCWVFFVDANRLAFLFRIEAESAAVGKNFFQSWEGTADTGVVSDFAVFVQWHVEVNAHNRFFTCEVVLFDCHFIEN